MSISFRCPCGARLRVNDTLADRLVRCPQCGNLTPVPARSAEEELSRSASVPSADGAHGYQSTPVRVPPPPDDLVDAEEVSEEESEVKEARRARRARRPARRSRRLILWLALLLAFLVLLIGVGGGLGWYFFLRPKGLTDELTYMPDKFEWIASARVATIVESDFYKSLKKEIDDNNPDFDRELKDMEKDLGLELKDIERVTAGGLFPQKGGADTERDMQIVVVIKTKKKVALDDLFKGERYREYHDSKPNSYTLRAYSGERLAVCVPDSKTIVLGEELTLRGVLVRLDKVKMTKGMENAMKHADFTDAAAVAFDLEDLLKNSVRDNPRGLDLPPELNSTIDAEKLTRFMEGGIVQLRLGSQVALEVQIFGQDSQATMSFAIKTTALIELIHDAAKSKGSPADRKKSRPLVPASSR